LCEQDVELLFRSPRHPHLEAFLGGAMGLLLAHAAIAMMVRSWPWAIPTPRSLFTMYRRSSSRSPIRLLLPVEMDAGRQKALEQVCATAQNDAVQSVELKADNLEAKSSPAQQSYNLHMGACNQKRKTRRHQPRPCR
jgi:hypothetical protein